jgi:uncharacterized membrane protein
VESRTDAQQRADAIRVFRQELARVEREGALTLTAGQLEALETHHQGLLARLEASFDIDQTAAEAQLSVGMRIASLLGAIALSASVFYLFRQFWGLLGTTQQVTILVAAPLIALVVTMAIHRRDPTGYFAGLAAVITLTCFVLNLVLLGKAFNIVPSPDSLLAWGALALVLAYAVELRLLLGAAIIGAGAWMAGRLSMVTGRYWSEFFERPEILFIPASIAFAVPLFISHRRYPGFPGVYRALGVAAGLAAIYALSHEGTLTYLPFERDWVEAGYQWVGFLASAAVAWLGIRRGWTECVNIGVAFFLLFLFTKFVDWWWETMPRYLFFLVIGLAAVLTLLALRRLRVVAGARASL